MTGYLLKMFGYSLGLTLLMELPLGILMGMRGRKSLLLMILVNLLTNPAAVFVCWLGLPQLPVEMVVVAAEAAVYCVFARKGKWKIPHPVWLSAVTNAVSWIGGILIQVWFAR